MPFDIAQRGLGGELTDRAFRTERLKVRGVFVLERQLPLCRDVRPVVRRPEAVMHLQVGQCEWHRYQRVVQSRFVVRAGVDFAEVVICSREVEARACRTISQVSRSAWADGRMSLGRTVAACLARIGQSAEHNAPTA